MSKVYDIRLQRWWIRKSEFGANTQFLLLKIAFTEYFSFGCYCKTSYSFQKVQKYCCTSGFAIAIVVCPYNQFDFFCHCSILLLRSTYCWLQPYLTYSTTTLRIRNTHFRSFQVVFNFMNSGKHCSFVLETVR